MGTSADFEEAVRIKRMKLNLDKWRSKRSQSGNSTIWRERLFKEGIKR